MSIDQLPEPEMIDMSQFEQAAALSSHIEAQRDNLRAIVQDMGNFGVFAEMIARGGKEHDEI